MSTAWKKCVNEVNVVGNQGTLKRAMMLVALAFCLLVRTDAMAFNIYAYQNPFETTGGESAQSTLPDHAIVAGTTPDWLPVIVLVASCVLSVMALVSIIRFEHLREKLLRVARMDARVCDIVIVPKRDNVPKEDAIAGHLRRTGTRRPSCLTARRGHSVQSRLLKPGRIRPR
jgi:hypothetical protein